MIIHRNSYRCLLAALSVVILQSEQAENLDGAAQENTIKKALVEFATCNRPVRAWEDAK